MSRSRYGHNVNASLIREVRMIAQQFFQGKTHQSIFDPKRQQPQAAVLQCGFCLSIKTRKPQDAITVMNGQAVCHDHMYYVQGGKHGEILTLIKRDEVRETR